MTGFSHFATFCPQHKSQHAADHAKLSGCTVCQSPAIVRVVGRKGWCKLHIRQAFAYANSHPVNYQVDGSGEC
jgi:hypothetical protein